MKQIDLFLSDHGCGVACMMEFYLIILWPVVAKVAGWICLKNMKQIDLLFLIMVGVARMMVLYLIILWPVIVVVHMQ